MKLFTFKNQGGFAMKANRIVLGAAVVLAVGLGAFWTGMSVGQEKKGEYQGL